MTLHYSNAEFTSDPVCSQVAEPERMGYKEIYDFDFFRTKVDVTSLSTCVAVNVGILSVAELDTIEGSSWTTTLPNSSVSVVFSERFDFRFPGNVM